jgi:hypothetical protein
MACAQGGSAYQKLRMNLRVSSAGRKKSFGNQCSFA